MVVWEVISEAYVGTMGADVTADPQVYFEEVLAPVPHAEVPVQLEATDVYAWVDEATPETAE